MIDKIEQKETEGRSATEETLRPWYIMAFTKGKSDRLDIYLTAITDSGKTYCGDIKAYLDPYHPRPIDKYPTYMADYDKLRVIKKTALNEGRIPILIAVTPDYLYIWNLFESNWERTCEWRKVNKTAIHYGEKEWELMAHLSLRDAHKIKRYLS